MLEKFSYSSRIQSLPPHFSVNVWGWPSECSYERLFEWVLSEQYTRDLLYNSEELEKHFRKKDPQIPVERFHFFLGAFNLVCLFVLKACQHRDYLVKYYSACFFVCSALLFALPGQDVSFTSGWTPQHTAGSGLWECFVSFNKTLCHGHTPTAIQPLSSFAAFCAQWLIGAGF